MIPHAGIAELILRAGGQERKFPLGEIPCGIGRSFQNAIVLEGQMISRNHAMVQRNESGGYSVFDLGSRNGTLLNGRRLTAPAALCHGDVLVLGEFTLVFCDVPPAPSSALRRASGNAPLETIVTFAAREITVLVVDIRDFTGLSRQLGETRLAQLMGAFNRETGAIFEPSRTWTVKYIGDAVLAIWDHRHHADALAVLRSAFEVVQAILHLAAGLQARFDLPRPLLVGMGLNTGIASLGNLGSVVTSDYTALGDVVNKAFRLEASTRQLDADLAFGQEVRKFLPDDLIQSLTNTHHVLLKGYSESCEVYSLALARIPTLLQQLQNKPSV